MLSNKEMIGAFLLAPQQITEGEQNSQSAYSEPENGPLQERPRNDILLKLLELSQETSGSKNILLQGLTKSGRTTLLLELAMTLASRTMRSHKPALLHCCVQCQSHPETCRCNDVDIILCRPQPIQPTTDPNNSNNNGTATISSFPHHLQQLIQQKASDLGDEYSPASLALHRIRVHTVCTRQQLLSLLFQVQARPKTELPRRAVLVDDLDHLAMASLGDLRHPGDSPQHSPPRHYHQQRQQQRHQEQEMILAQLAALLVDTTKFLNRTRRQNIDRDNNGSPNLVLGVTSSTTSSSTRYPPRWSWCLLPHHFVLERIATVVVAAAAAAPAQAAAHNDEQPPAPAETTFGADLAAMGHLGG